jgi:plasmid maintenance system antidote protein VapI
MKENDARIEFDSHQLLLYVEKSDGEYGPLQTGSFLTKNYVDDFWEKKKKFTERMFKKLTNGEISPVAYYMQMIEISPAEVASRIGISPAAVKKHQDVKHFSKLTIDMLQKYANVFGVTLADMFQIQEPDVTGYLIRQSKTKNPCVTVLSVVKEKK